MKDDDVLNVLEALGAGDVRGACRLAVAAADDNRDLAVALESALLSGDDLASVARRLGDALREARCNLRLVNECYRFAFYADASSSSVAQSDFFSLFLARRGKPPVDKWPHFFPIYDEHLSGFRGGTAKVLEIGTYQGGGLDLLRDFLGPRAQLIGLDNDPEAVETAGQRHNVLLGDQSDEELLVDLSNRYGPFDVVIDDGSHFVEHQLVTMRTLLPLMADGGKYIVEDTHTSYWPEYGGAVNSPVSFIGQLSHLIDDLHAYHWSHSTPPGLLTNVIRAVHVYDSLVIIDCGQGDPPFSEVSGGFSFVRSSRLSEAVSSELVRSREFMAAQVDSLSAKTNELERLVSRYEAVVGHLQLQAVRADDEFHRALKRAKRADRQRDFALKQLGQLQSSRSWRMVLWLRRLKARLKWWR